MGDLPVNFTCPHCGRYSVSPLKPEELELVGDDWFPVLAPGEERHINERLACAECWGKADSRLRNELGAKIGPHPWSHEFHKVERLGKPVGEKR